ncbi:MAG: AMP-binding protein, partial [Bacteroidales bacterium]|nr:AMP-binding protein [Bacteroidales bacterium]
MDHYLARLQNAARKYWDKPALNDIGGETFTYGQMARSIERFHIVFEKAGIAKGDKIALCARNGARWGISYLAVNTYEAVIVPILYDFLPDSVCYLVDHSESRILFTDKDKWEKMDISKMPNVNVVLNIETWELLYCKDEKVTDAYSKLDALFAERFPDGFGPDNVVYPVDNLDNLSTINYTSGSTGSPKGVMLTYRNFSANIDFAQRFIPTSDKCKMVSMLPMAHMYGLAFEFLYPLANGTGIYWLGKTPTPSALLKAFAEVKPYLLITVPLVMEKIFKSKIKPV